MRFPVPVTNYALATEDDVSNMLAKGGEGGPWDPAVVGWFWWIDYNICSSISSAARSQVGRNVLPNLAHVLPQMFPTFNEELTM